MATEEKTAEPATLASEGQSRSEKQIALHPLVIINASDHYTRVSTTSGSSARVLGILLGVQSGLSLDVLNSFEVLHTQRPGGEVELDSDFLKRRIEQFVRVFPTFEVLGWYTTGAEPTAEDMLIHKQVSDYNENPLLLLLDPHHDERSKDLPVSLYESELHMVKDVPTHLFVSLPFKIETTEAERVSVDHVSKVSPAGEDGVSPLIQHMKSTGESVRTLKQKLDTLRVFLEQTQSGAIPRNHKLLRQVASVCGQMPVAQSPAVAQQLHTELNDSMLVAHLSALLKGVALADDVAGKGSVSFPPPAPRVARRGGGYAGMGMGMGMGMGLGDFGEAMGGAPDGVMGDFGGD